MSLGLKISLSAKCCLTIVSALITMLWNIGNSYAAASVMFDPIVVTTLAGDGTTGFADGIGTAAKFKWPYGLAADNLGNLWVADQGDNRIRKIVIATGAVTTIAGDGTESFADGIGTAAKFDYPSGIAADAEGNLWVADWANQRIRKIDIATGAVTTIAGNRKIGFADGIGTAALFYNPRGIAADVSGNLYVADTGNHSIRKIDMATESVTTLTGNRTSGFADGIGTAAKFNYPFGVVADTVGNLYVADSYNNRIRKIVLATAEVTTIAGNGVRGFTDGIGTAAQFSNPSGLATDNAGNLWVSDTWNHRIRKIVIATGEVTTVAGDGTQAFLDGLGTAARFQSPLGVVADTAGNLYVADYGDSRIRKMAPPKLSMFSTIAGIASAAQSFCVSGNSLTGDLTITAPTGYEISLSSDSDYASSLNITPVSGVVNSKMIYVRLATANGIGTYNGNITLDSAGANQRVLVVSGIALEHPPPNVMFDPIEVSTLAGDMPGFTDGIGTAAKFGKPEGITADIMGNLYVTEGSRIRKIDPATRLVTTLAGSDNSGFIDAIGAAAQFYSLGGISSDTTGNLYVADEFNNRIRKINTITGMVTTLAGQYEIGWLDGIGTAAKLRYPHGVAADNTGNLWVADTENYRIRKIVIATGEVTTIAGDGTDGFADGIGTFAKFKSPLGIAADTSGYLYVADSSRIRKIFTRTGQVTTLAGSDTSGFADGIGAAAMFKRPYGLSADTSGNLYVADHNNYRIRKIVIATGVVTTLAGQDRIGRFDGIGTAALFDMPSDVVSDNSGNLYVADSYNSRIRKMTPPVLNGFSTIAGTASAVQFFSVSGNFLIGNLTITAPTAYEVSMSSDSGYAQSLNITPTGGSVSSQQIYIRLSAAAGVGTYNGSIALDSTGAARKTLAVSGTIVPSPPPTVVFDSTAVTTLAGDGTTGFADGIGAAAKFNNPKGISADASGNLYVADFGNNRIRKIIAATGEVTTLAGDGTFSFADGIGTAAKFSHPYDVSMDTSGNLWVADSWNLLVRKIVIATGEVSTLAGKNNNMCSYTDGIGDAAGFCDPSGISADAHGNLWVFDRYRIRKIVIATGEVTTVAGGTSGFTDGVGPFAQFSNSESLSSDAAGNLYVADYGNNRIRKIIVATGVVTTVAGDGSFDFADGIGTAAKFCYPLGIFADSLGNLWVADSRNSRIRKIVVATGEVTTLAGGTSGFTDGIGTAAKFSYPSSIVADSSGNLYVTDGGNRIRKITPPTLAAFSSTPGTASDAQFFGISGYFLTDSLTITVPTGYEVSLNSGSDYVPSLNITPTSGVVNSKMIYIRLSASAGAGIYNGNITLDSAGAAQKTLTVTGTIIAPEISLKQGAADIASGGSYNFGNVNVGSNSGAAVFTIENTGNTDLTLSGTPKVAISGSSDFSVDQRGVSSPIAASGSRSFTVTFTPSYTGAKNAVITVASNDRDEGSYSVTLNGTGTAAPITAGVSMVSVSNVKATTAISEAYSGESGATERGFFWWNDTQYWGDNASGLIPAGGSGAGVFSLTLSNLPAKTQLYVSAYVKIGDQIITSGNKISITTTDPIMPTVITKPDFTVNGNEILAKGEITDTGGSAVTIYGFVYAAHTSPTVWDQALPFTWDMTLPISVGKAFEGTIKNLSDGTYYFRAYAHNAQGTAYGEEFSFSITGDCTGGVPGDLNGDGNVDLTDVIIALKILDGVPVSNPNLKADVNGDCRIGHEEAIFVLQKVGMLR